VVYAVVVKVKKGKQCISV